MSLRRTAAGALAMPGPCAGLPRYRRKHTFGAMLSLIELLAN